MQKDEKTLQVKAIPNENENAPGSGKRSFEPRLWKQITVRLSKDLLAKLGVEAHLREVTITDVIRAILGEYFRRGKHLEEAHELIRTLREELKCARRELALTTEVLLVFAGQSSEEEAKRFIKENYEIV